MKIIYLASVYDPDVYRKLFRSGSKPIQAANKYHTLMCEGFVANGCRLVALSCLPVNRAINSRFFIFEKPSVCNGVSFHYLPLVNLKPVKQLSAFFRLLFASGDSVLVYDGLVVSASWGACLGAKLRGIKTCCILTDLPANLSIGASSLGKRINDTLISFADSFILLTEQMNDVVNKKRRPYLVSEGHSDIAMKSRQRAAHEGDGKTRLMYAGGLEAKYGLDALCRAFLAIRREGEELHLYGKGGYLPVLKELAREENGLFYHGVISAAEVVDRELEADLLVNPRSPDEDFTRYSFPSKTMEYMASGFPVVMCRLPGMPEEYCPYVYLFDSGKEADIAAKLRQLLDLPAEELRKKGSAAKAFVLEKKNNVVQTKRILDRLLSKL